MCFFAKVYKIGHKGDKRMSFLNEFWLWWHWIVLGMFFLIIELMIGTFFIIGFGIVAILVGVMAWSFDTSFNAELFVWTIFSIIAIGIWYKWFREPDISDSGQSNYRLDTIGTVQEAIAPHSRGKVKFDNPVLGNSVWHATAQTDISPKTRVKIVRINGQLIEVAPL